MPVIVDNVAQKRLARSRKEVGSTSGGGRKLHGAVLSKRSVTTTETGCLHSPAIRLQTMALVAICFLTLASASTATPGIKPGVAPSLSKPTPAASQPEVAHHLHVASSAGDKLSSHWIVELHAPATDADAKNIARQFGFEHRGPLRYHGGARPGSGGAQTGSGVEKEDSKDPVFHMVEKQTPRHRMKRSVEARTKQLKDHPMVKDAKQQVAHVRRKRGFRGLETMESVPNDPLFKHQWYLKNDGQAGGKKGLDLNVMGAWKLGFTGKNVTTAILDDGIDYTHPDLMYNYNAKASYDYSSNDPFPYPRYTDTWFNSHGTRCAGEISARRDNHICGVGVAYDSKVAGIRMLDQPYMTDLIEANSMGHEPQLIDIYSASWGPTDDGKTVDGPRNYTMRAIVNGINRGRGGRGNIYVWASGDGGEKDDCNCDGYAASMWTISINSAINDGRTALYDESCSSTLASTFSNGRSANPEAGVATTDLYGSCTLKHSGTSAAAPEAAGVFALALEANPKLTWRDIQHLTVLTSKRNRLRDPTGRHGWHVNGAGLEFNHLFGFGVLDAGSMVIMATNWTSGPPRYHCKAGTIIGKTGREFDKRNPLKLTIETSACDGSDGEEEEDGAAPVRYLEHVQAFVSLKSTRRGSTVMYLTSPMGTRSLILSKRPDDADSTDGFVKWPFMTTQCWGENPKGRWTLEVLVNEDNDDVENSESHGKGPRAEEEKEEEASGVLTEWMLMLHGTQSPPYIEMSASDSTSKLAIAKRAQEKMEEMRKRSA